MYTGKLGEPVAGGKATRLPAYALQSTSIDYA